LVDSLQAAGADFVETYIDSKFMIEPSGLFFALAAAARQAGLPFGGHAPVIVTDHAIDSGARFLANQPSLLSLEKPGICDDWYANATGGVQDCAAIAEKLRRHGTWIVVTPPLPRLRYQLDLYHRYFPRTLPTGPALPGMRFDPDTWFTVAGSLPAAGRPRNIESWRTALDHIDSITGTMLFPLPHRGRVQESAGLQIVLGTDAVFAPSAFMGLPGFTLHDALAMLVLDGMTPLGALRAATLNPALSLHLADSLGTVDVGKVADLVLLDADPLADITNTTQIRAVVANGRYFDRVALDGLLAQAERAAQQSPRQTRQP
jgi:hypothetical protein